MLATDGGVHLTKDQGKQWTLTGSNVGGFVALQVGEMTGRQVGGSSPHLDLYYGTQDNDIKGSSDGGATWNGSLCCEGAFLQVDRANPAMVDGRVTGRQCGNCSLFDVQPHLGQGDPGKFRNAPSSNPSNPDAHAPFQLIGDNYLQPLKVPPNAEYWLTGNRGANWALSFTTPGTHVGRIHFAGDLANPVAYVALEKGQGAKLIRASAVSGAPVVSAADQIGMGTIGLLCTGQARYAVVGVDPKEPNHLLAHDIFSGTKASRDGGVNWFALPALDAAITDTGKFKVSMNNAPFVTTIAWDPTNSCHILVGTMQNGVIRSADGGLTWGTGAWLEARDHRDVVFLPAHRSHMDVNLRARIVAGDVGSHAAGIRAMRLSAATRPSPATESIRCDHANQRHSARVQWFAGRGCVRHMYRAARARWVDYRYRRG